MVSMYDLKKRGGLVLIEENGGVIFFAGEGREHM